MCHRIMFIGMLVSVFYGVSAVSLQVGAASPSGGALSLQAGELIYLKASVAGVEGGTSSFLVQKVQRQGKETFLQAVIHARTNTFFDKIHKVNNIFTSWFPVFSDRPFQYRLDVDQGGLKQTRRLHFEINRLGGLISLAVNTYANTRGPVWRPWTRRHRVPTNTKNLVGALYHARFLPYQLGKSFSFHVFVMGKLWVVQGRAVRKTRLSSAIGPRPAIELEAWTYAAESPRFKRQIRIWLSDDADRIPLKITGHVPQIGTAQADVISYRRNYHSRTLTANSHPGKNKQGSWGFLSDF